jgi:anaerobic dimethyl sulfoxide reductase subunit B (iron-sulfur subunit)
MHCADPQCVKTCPADAIKKRPEDGIVMVDRDKCIGCRTCEKSCPFGAPQFGSDGKMQKCDLCLSAVNPGESLPPCAETCPTKALVVRQMDEGEKLSSERDIRKMLHG